MNIILPKQAGTNEGALLFQKSEKVTDFDLGRKIIDSLKATMDYYGGVGLAAPQIGFSHRIFIVNIKSSQDDHPTATIGFHAYINPEILTVSSEVNGDSEGCLSLFYATIYGWVKRPIWIKMKYVDIKGKEHVEEIDSPFHARVILHENDHLEGKVFLQRMQEEDFSTLCWDEKLDIRKNPNNQI
ncbi:MAG: peptide deformylase [Candidatus Atribacteria bacterium]|nr:peptide deformylase [Candidatus Atribacteria bacterium]